MRKFKVGHEALPHVGELFEITTSSGLAVTVVAHRSGRRDLAVTTPGDDQPHFTLPLTRTEAMALSTLLAGPVIDLTTAPRP
jgi:K+/H+ antiporter YhaU regulatory subunit KhtT